MNIDAITRPNLPYQYEFEPNELDEIKSCTEEHGFCVVKGMISAHFVDELKTSIWEVLNPARDIKQGESRVKHAFVEFSRPLRKLLENEEFLNVHRKLVDSEELIVHRSAAILRNPGSAPVSWHTDWCGFYKGPPRNNGDVLNCGEWPSGKWFYLNGSHPKRGGICVVADSHRMDWSGPEGFDFTEHRKSFYPKGSEPKPYSRMDPPEVVHGFTEPEDMIVFAHRTYHGAFSNHMDEPRFSCALGFKPPQPKIDTPWPMTRSGQAFMDELPAQLKHFVEGYPSLDTEWKGADV